LDKLAKSALVSAIASGSRIEGDLPFKGVWFSLSGNKISSSPCLALEANWGYHAVELLYDEKDIIQKSDFHLVWWDGLGAAMSRYPKMYHVWLTKHVSNFCGNNVQLYHWSRGKHLPNCKLCGTEDTYSTHICWFRDLGRDQMFRLLVSELRAWMATTLGEMTVASTIKAFLLAWGEATMVAAYTAPVMIFCMLQSAATTLDGIV
jgi:hypothetical protein